MSAKTELEQDAARIACEQAGIPRAPVDPDRARQRAGSFIWVNAQGDYQCPKCWVADGLKSPLLPLVSALPTEPHFECARCGFHFIEQ